MSQVRVEDGLRDSGRAGEFGGRYAPEVLTPALQRLEREAKRLFDDPVFRAELSDLLETWVGRPTPLSAAPNLGDRWGGRIWLKREDLAHTGAHKINNALGQALLAREMGAARVIAETGAGQHGVASAAACARVGLGCVVYMGEVDIVRQAPNVERMKLMGTDVVSVTSGDRTLRAAINEAMRAWVADPIETYYLLGSAVGPHPYPWLVREIQSVIGVEARSQVTEVDGGLPDAVIACVGGGSNAIGIFHPFVDDGSVELIGVEAGGVGPGQGENAATIGRGRPGVLHGSYSYMLQDDDGQVFETHSVSAGLDYPGVGPEHSYLASSGRASYVEASDDEALAALDELARHEGILAALESSHALAGAKRYLADHPGATVLVGLSGRGDKDIDILRGLGR
ncbi:MAG: tryptophan synthase subunit beta [Acidimicrobiia bacterium]|nr:tryptophan synthase subunit beta [Acidimicrobiia bacterium]MDH3463349.1 tryptophan synthase subunit beta [Acidimicrobiia bacterium]